MATKHCNGCSETKHRSDFHRNKNTRDGCAHRCKACVALYTKGYRAENTDRQREYMARWHEANRGRRYGCGPETYRLLEEEAQGRCAICGQTPPDRLVVDHDHATGAIRQMLCRSCNAAIGALNDDPGLLEAAAQYLRRHAEFPRPAIDGPSTTVIAFRNPPERCSRGHEIRGVNARPRGNSLSCVACNRARGASYKARRDGREIDVDRYADKVYHEITKRSA